VCEREMSAPTGLFATVCFYFLFFFILSLISEIVGEREREREREIWIIERE